MSRRRLPAALLWTTRTFSSRTDITIMYGGVDVLSNPVALVNDALLELTTGLPHRRRGRRLSVVSDGTSTRNPEQLSPTTTLTCCSCRRPHLRAAAAGEGSGGAAAAGLAMALHVVLGLAGPASATSSKCSVPGTAFYIGRRCGPHTICPTSSAAADADLAP